MRPPPPPALLVGTPRGEGARAEQETVRLFVGTWNLHGSDPDEDLSLWLGEHTGAAAADVFAIGTQEAERSIQASVFNVSKARWMAQLEAALGAGYQCVGSQTLVAIHLAVFVKASLLPLISGVQSAHVATGLGGALGNKGGVAIAMNVGLTSFLFVNAHFAAHQHKVEQRNADFHRIDSQLLLRPLRPTAQPPPAKDRVPAGPMTAPPRATRETPPPSPPPSPSTVHPISDPAEPPPPVARALSLPHASSADSDDDDDDDATSDMSSRAGALAGTSPPAGRPSGRQSPPTFANSASSRFDRVFFFGDLNYRISGNREAVDALLAPPDERARAADDWRGEEAHWEAMRAVLLANDQLQAQMSLGTVFPGWAEGPIHFRPTYKFDKRERDAYDLSEKRRIPAYTDRILYKPAPPGWASSPAGTAPASEVEAAEGEAPIQLRRYDSVPSLRSSDHKPVVAEFDVRIDGWHESQGASSTLRPHHGLARGGSRHNVSQPQSARPGGTSAQSAVCTVM